MNCKFCETPNEEGSVFCAACGKRIDGKKQCPSCKRFIKEEYTYCNLCGARTDGKTVCGSCGEVFEGSFCPKCGIRTAPAVKGASRAASAWEGSQASKILDIVKSSLLYAGIAILFICSFFIGLTISYGGKSESSGTSFYFLITVFKDLSTALDAMKGMGTVYPELYIAFYLPAILDAVVIAANIIVCTTFFIVATVKFVKGFQEKQSVSLGKYFIIPAVTTLAALLFTHNFYYSLIGALQSTGSVGSLSYSVPVILEIVFVSVLAAAAMVLTIIIERKKLFTGEYIYKYSFYGSAAVFVIVCLIVSNTTMLYIQDISCSATLLMMSALAALGVTVEPAGSQVSFGAYSVVLYVMYLAIFVVLTVILLFLLLSIFCKKNPRGLLALSICMLSASVVSLIFSLLTQALPGTSMQIGAMPICMLVFSLILLAVFITASQIIKKYNSNNAGQSLPKQPQFG